MPLPVDLKSDVTGGHHQPAVIVACRPFGMVLPAKERVGEQG